MKRGSLSYGDEDGTLTLECDAWYDTQEGSKQKRFVLSQDFATVLKSRAQEIKRLQYKASRAHPGMGYICISY